MFGPLTYSYYQYASAEQVDPLYEETVRNTFEHFKKTAPQTERNQNIIDECSAILKKTNHKVPLTHDKVDRIFEMCGVSLPESLELCKVEKPVPCEEWEDIQMGMARLGSMQIERLFQYEQLWIQPWFEGADIERLQPSQKVLGYVKCLLKYRDAPAPKTDRQAETLKKVAKWSFRNGVLRLTLQEICDMCELFSLPLRWVLGVPDYRLLYTTSIEREKVLERYLIMTQTGRKYVLESLINYEG